MRRTGRTDSSVGYGPRDHLCWAHRGEDDWRAGASRFLADGAVGGDRLVYVADEPEEGLVNDLAGLAGRDVMLRSGQLVVRRSADFHEVADGAVDPDAQLAMLDALGEAAVADGYRGLRLAADVSAFAGSDAAADRMVAYELRLDAAVATSPWAVMCGYDGKQVGVPAATALSFVHPLRRDEPGPGGVAGVGASLHAGKDGRWCLAGEVDVALRDALVTALAALPGGGLLHVDLSAVEHVEVSGVRALAALAVVREPAGGVVLHRPPEVVVWMLDRWGAVPGLEVRS